MWFHLDGLEDTNHIYRRYTNFSMESIMQTFSGNIGYGNRVSATISRNGDLVHKMYVEFKPNEFISTAATGAFLAPNVTHTLLKEIELEIGCQRIDKHYGHWLTVWNNLTDSNLLGNK